VFSSEEIEKLRSTADSEMRLLIDIALYAGLRRTELYYLRWKDIDLSQKVIHVRPHGDFVPKNKRPGTVPINSRLFKILKKVYPKPSGVKQGDFVFPHNHNGNPKNPTQILSNRFRRLAIKAKVKNAGLHDCRHTFASQLVQAGVPLLVVKELLRHTDIQSTMVYAHLAPDLQRNAVDKLSY
jgi:integrase